jgi:hypothetical protein
MKVIQLHVFVLLILLIQKGMGGPFPTKGRSPILQAAELSSTVVGGLIPEAKKREDPQVYYNFALFF